MPRGLASNHLLGDPDFRRLWAADALSQLGTRVTMLAVPLLAVLTLQASALEVSLLRTAETSAWLLFGLVAGGWVDRMRCRPLLIATDLGRALLLASIPVVAWTSNVTLLQLYVVLVLVGILTVFFDVAHGAYLPRLVRSDRLLQGNSLLATNASVSAVAGDGIGWLPRSVAHRASRNPLRLPQFSLVGVQPEQDSITRDPIT
jgi:MFS family permease